jgi:GAF domain-containing protein
MRIKRRLTPALAKATVLRMVEVTQALAERVSEVARLLETDDDQDAVLGRLTSLGVDLVPGATAAAVTVTAGDQAHTFASSDARVDELHRLQFASEAGPVVETLRYNETRHVRDVAADPRWPAFCQAASDAGFGSCITVPLHTRQEPAGAVALYAERPDAFSGAAHDLALLFAAQGGTAAHNADLYGASSQVVRNLQVALESRAVIEQAKGVVHAELGVSTDEAFRLLSRASQNTNQKVRDIAAKLVRGDISPRHLPPRR